MTAARSSADTHQALMDAALEVFVQRGFARATTREIAAAAGVAEGTIYRHFADKHALFRAVFFSAIGGMGEELRRLPERAGSGTVRDNLEYLFGLLEGLQERSAPLLTAQPSLRGTVRLGGMTDCFQPSERRVRNTVLRHQLRRRCRWMPCSGVGRRCRAGSRSPWNG